ncbi:MAG: S8 family serine peptidase, partial [Planctomycetes bacterium]|nr:S8 family serine peptidase [Planctomycetota bacterium]
MLRTTFVVIVILIQILFNSLVFAGGLIPPRLDPHNPQYKSGEILVKFKDDLDLQIHKEAGLVRTGQSSLDELNSTWNISGMEKVHQSAVRRTDFKTIRTYIGETIEVAQLFNIYKLEFPEDQNVSGIVDDFADNSNVDYAEPNYYFYNLETIPNDPSFASQWYLGAFPGVRATEAWDLTTGGTTQVIGVIDTGVDWDHPDLINKIWNNVDESESGFDNDSNGYSDDVRGWDFVNNDNDPNDDNSHGSHVAGIAAAETNNSTGVAGLAWDAKIMPLKALQSSGYGSSSDIAEAVNYAAANGATVINMSLGGYGESQTLKTALENAYANAVLVAAAGNDGYKVDPPYPPWPPYAPMYPACYSWVIGVQAIDQSGDLAAFSNFDPSGPFVAANDFGHNYEIKAPGVSIHSTFPNSGYNSLNGTSMATPIVAGAVALMKSYNPAQSTEQIFARLIQGSNNGILDIRNSLDYVLTPDLYYQGFTVVDTLPGADDDGVADAGETIEIYLTVKNGGGWADSVWTKLRLGEFEDPSVATIFDSTSYIGDISAYATLTGEADPFRIAIDPGVANN